MSIDEILDLPEKIAADRKMKIVICIDEFQQIGMFESPKAFQATLRSKWQLQQHVSYCLYGSRRHMMMEVFGKVSMPFYKFGAIYFLEKSTDYSGRIIFPESFLTPENGSPKDNVKE